mgnify:CR=1 FL=1
MDTSTNNPLVSICCITYNHHHYIRQCLNGFLMQKTNFAFEVIINDDCSTDGTTEILREYASKNPDIIKPIFQDENQYAKGVRGMFQHFVFPKAQGKYIAICEGDDYWTDPLKLQKQVDYLETHPNFSMCFHRVECLAEKGREKQDLFGYLTTKDYAAQDSNDFLKKWLVPTCSIVMRGELLHKIPHNPLFTYGDSVLVATCLSNGLIHCIGEDMGVYRLTPGGWNGSQTEIKKAKLQISHTKGMMQEFDFYRCSTMYRFLEHFYFILLIYYKENKNYSEYNLIYKDYIEQFKCIKRSSFNFYFLKYKIKKLLKTILR